MTITTEQRSVQRSVKVYRCNRCRAESLEDALTGWLIVLEFEVQMVPTIMVFTPTPQLGTKHGADLHLCPGCAPLVRQLAAQTPAPTMVGNDIANIPIRTADGSVVMLTRYEYDRWAARGKPPVLSADDVKVKS